MVFAWKHCGTMSGELGTSGNGHREQRALRGLDGFLIVVLGPTASGKSNLAEALASALDGEIVSADSMQVYRGMDIGTAKVPPESRCCRYHCIDIADPGDPFSVALFQKLARAAIDDIHLRGKTAILCGGTGLYIQAVTDRMEFPKGEQVGNAARDKYKEYGEQKGSEALHGLLAKRDPASAACIHPNNTRRVIRALEMLDEGVSYANQKEGFSRLESWYKTIYLGLDVEVQELYRHIDKRVDYMLEQGLLEEVRRLLAQGFREGVCAPQAIGYKEFVPILDGGFGADSPEYVAAVASVKQATRRYAKRQRTWFKRNGAIHWLDASRGIDEALVSEALLILDECSKAAL